MQDERVTMVASVSGFSKEECEAALLEHNWDVREVRLTTPKHRRASCPWMAGGLSLEWGSDIRQTRLAHRVVMNDWHC